jgi:lipopolysaccharide transport system permease protein
MRATTVLRPPARAGLALFGQLGRLPHYGDLLYTLTLHRIRVRYKQSVLGLLWAVLQPLLLMLVFTIIFGFTTRMPSEGLPYAVFVYAAVLPWTFLSTAVSNGTGSLVGHAQMITKVAFPRELLPLSYVGAALADFLIASTLLGGLMIYYRVPLTGYAMFAIPLAVVLAAFATAVSLMLAAVQVHVRDIGVALPLLLQVWMFATPVIYPLRAVPMRFRALYDLNPAVGLIENFRRVTLLGEPPDLRLLAISIVATALLVPAAYAGFKYVEATVADRV